MACVMAKCSQQNGLFVIEFIAGRGFGEAQATQ
jgi:hypothetical protein